MNPISLKKLMNSPSPARVMIEETKGLISKWEPTGLLEGLKSEYEYSAMATMLENQARQLLDESTRTGGESAEQWSGVALPLVRRIFGEIAAKEFVSVQPMNMPSGLVFYMDFKYGSGNQPGFTQNTSVFGGKTNGLFGRTEEATNGLYGDGRFGYSINNFVSASLVGTISSASWYDAEFNASLSASAAAGELKKVSVAMGPEVDYVGAKAFSISGSGIVNYYPAHTAASATSTVTTVVFIVSASADAGDFTTTVNYHTQPSPSTRGDFEDRSASGSYQSLDIPEIDLQLKSEQITAKTRKLKAVWTPEMAQDLNAYHSVDAESELTSLLSEYISMEIDLEILDMLMQSAITEEYWSARVGYEYNNLTNSFAIDSNSAAASAYTKNNWFQTLGVKINKASNKIMQLTMRGGANFMVVSPDVATILESIPGFTGDVDTNKMQYAMGVSKVGSFANRYAVYKNPYMTQNVILLGFKGTTFLETGAVYAPFIPLIMTPLVYDPTNLTPRKGVMTRYAKKCVRPEYYARILIEGLNTL